MFALRAVLAAPTFERAALLRLPQRMHLAQSSGRFPRSAGRGTSARAAEPMRARMLARTQPPPQHSRGPPPRWSRLPPKSRSRVQAAAQVISTVRHRERDTPRPASVQRVFCHVASLVGKMSHAERAAFFDAHMLEFASLRERLVAGLDELDDVELSDIALACGRHGGAECHDVLGEVEARLAPQIGALEPRTVAMLLWAHTASGTGSMALYEVAEPAVRARVAHFEPHGLSSIAWAYAKRGQLRAPLADELATEVVRRTGLGADGPRILATMAWAFGNAPPSEARARVLDVLAAEAVPIAAQMGARDLAQIVWVYAKAAHDAPELFAAVEAVAPAQLHRFNSQDFANVTWAFASAGVDAPALFSAVAVAVQPRLDEFTPQGLANLAWAFAKTGAPSAELLLGAIGDGLGAWLPALDAKHVSQLAWAFAKTGVDSARALRAIAAELDARPSVHDFGEAELTQTVYAYAAARVEAAALLQRLFGRIITRLDSFEAQSISVAAWSLARSKVQAPGAFAKIAAEVQRRGEAHFSSQHVTNLIWAFATMGEDGKELVAATGPAIVARARTFKAQEIANVAWALAVMQLHPPDVLRAVFDAAESFFDEPSWKIGGTESLCQLHQANMAMRLEAPQLGIELSAQMRQRCYESMRNSAMGDFKLSRLHMSVSEKLSKLGVEHTNEVCLPVLGYHVDVVLHGHSTVIEVNGPAHYAEGGKLHPTMQMKIRHMRQMGWHVLTVPHWEWAEALSDGEGMAYLQRLLDAAERDVAAAAAADSTESSRFEAGS